MGDLGVNPRRRRRAKRGGKQIAAPELSRAQYAQARSDARRPDSEDQAPPRKRKRRRARANGQASGQAAPASQASQAGQADSGAATGKSSAAVPPGQASRRKGRGKKAQPGAQLAGTVLWRLRCRARVHLAEGLHKGSPLLHRPHRRSRFRLAPVSLETTAIRGILPIGRHAGRRPVSRGRISGDVPTRTISMLRWISARTIAVC